MGMSTLGQVGCDVALRNCRTKFTAADFSGTKSPPPGNPLLARSHSRSDRSFYPYCAGAHPHPHTPVSCSDSPIPPFRGVALWADEAQKPQALIPKPPPVKAGARLPPARRPHPIAHCLATRVLSHSPRTANTPSDPQCPCQPPNPEYEAGGSMPKPALPRHTVPGEWRAKQPPTIYVSHYRREPL